MSNRKTQALAISAAFCLLLAGCSQAAPDAQPAAAAVAVGRETAAAASSLTSPAAASKPNAAAGAPVAAPVAATVMAVEPSSLLNSYRLRASAAITATAGAKVLEQESANIGAIWQRQPGPFGFDAAYTMQMTDTQNSADVTYVLVGDQAAVKADNQWTTLPRKDAQKLNDPVGLLDSPPIDAARQGENLGAAAVNGIDTVHYRLTDLASLSKMTGNLFAERAGALQQGVLDVWVAEPGYVVKYTLSASGRGSPGPDGATVDAAVALAYELYDINHAPKLEWPAEAPPPGALVIPGFAPNEFPVPDGSHVEPAVGALTVQVAQTIAGVTDFYRRELGRLGWSWEGSGGLYRIGRNGVNLNLAITPSSKPEGGVQVEVFAPEK